MSLSTKLKSVRDNLVNLKLDCLLVTSPSNIFYLTGLHPNNEHGIDSCLIITQDLATFLHSPLISPAKTSKLLAIIPTSSTIPLSKHLTQHLNSSNSIGYESHHLTVNQFKNIQKLTPNKQYIPADEIFKILRTKKDSLELKKITRASKITAKTMTWATELLMKFSQNPQQFPPSEHLLTQIFVGDLKTNQLTEKKLAWLIEQKMNELGSSALAFDCIVAFDSNTAIPHHQPGLCLLTPHSIVLLDIGAKFEGYCSDMTRTICLSPTPPQEYLMVKKVVDNAFKKGMKSLSSTTSSPITGSDIDTQVRSHIKNCDYGDYFTHATGHGLGLNIHEEPSLSPHSKTQLINGMIITLEPGIYLPNQFGYRHEDTIALSNKGIINLTLSTFT